MALGSIRMPRWPILSRDYQSRPRRPDGLLDQLDAHELTLDVQAHIVLTARPRSRRPTASGPPITIVAASPTSHRAAEVELNRSGVLQQCASAHPARHRAAEVELDRSGILQHYAPAHPHWLGARTLLADVERLTSAVVRSSAKGLGSSSDCLGHRASPSHSLEGAACVQHVRRRSAT
jgi:hypothetical protein